MMITRTRILVAALVAMTVGTAAHAQQPVPKPKAALPAAAHPPARHGAPGAAPQMHKDTTTRSRASQRRKHSAPAAPAKP